MEASSAAAQTGGDAGAEGQAAAGEGAEGAQEAQGADPLAPVLERMGEIGGRVDSLAEAIAALPGAQEGESGEYEQQRGADGQFLPAAGEADPMLEQLEAVYGPDQAQQIVQGLAQQMTAQMEAQVAPLAQTIAELRIDAGAKELEEKYPDLAPGEVSEAVWTEAQQLASEFGNPDLVLNHKFIERVYLSRVARERAESQTAAGTQEGQVDLESGDGANPAGTGTDDAPPQQRIREAGRGRGGSVFGF